MSAPTTPPRYVPHIHSAVLPPHTHAPAKPGEAGHGDHSAVPLMAPEEPADRTALYWPETPTSIPATLALRDDTAAKDVVPHRPEAHWHLPNLGGQWLTWAELLEVLVEEELDLADAVRLTPDDVPVQFVHPELGPMPGYVVGRCGHRVAQSEWRAGFRTCERCPSEATS